MAEELDPNELIAKQFGAQRQALQQKQKQAEETANMAVDRQSAITGLNGGAALKVRENANRGVNETFNDAQNQLAGQESAAKLGSNQFQQQLGEQKRQFNENMKYTYAELDENKKTNMLNAVTALEKTGFFANGAPNLWKMGQASDLLAGFNEIFSGRGYTAPAPKRVVQQ